jgi:hypothetical protein
MTRWRLLRAASLVAALVLMGVLVARLGPREIARHVVTAGPGVIWLLVVYVAGTAISGLAWSCAFTRTARPGAGDAVASRLAASGVNTILPLAGFGGEPVRLLWLRPEQRAAGVAAIIVDRFAYVAASVVVLLAGVIAVVEVIPQFPRAYTLAAALACGVLVLGIVAGVWLTARHRVAGRIHLLILRVRRKVAPPEGARFGDDVDRQIEDALRGRAPWHMLAIHVAGRALLGAEVYVGFYLLDVPLSWDQTLVFVAVPIFLSFAGVLIPSQLGILEGSQALVAAALGVPVTAAVAVVLLQRVRQLASGAIAWILLASVRRRDPATRDRGTCSRSCPDGTG